MGLLRQTGRRVGFFGRWRAKIDCRDATFRLTVRDGQAPMVMTENEEVTMPSKSTTALPLTLLPGLTRPELLKLWQTLWGRAAPAGLRRELMIPILAYRTQEKAYGGLNPEAERRLCKLSAALEGGRASPPKERRVKPATRLLREWRGQTHEVIATEQGFLYQGKSQKSLSGIARQITGTRWSGPVFFGLKSRSEGNSER
jgi:hypothetical protein